jgi:hypothetical protein
MPRRSAPVSRPANRRAGKLQQIHFDYFLPFAIIRKLLAAMLQ